MAVVGEASIIVRAVTTGVRNDIRRAFDGIDNVGERAGRDAGSSFTRGFRRGSGGDVASLFGKSLSQGDVDRFTQARKRFLELVRVGYVLAPVIAGVGGVIGSLVGGIGVLISVVGAATPALLGLSGAFLAVAAGAGVLRAAFGGVGEAISAGAKVGRNAAADAEALKAANDRLADAYYNLDETVRNSARRLEEAEEAASDASIAVADAAIAVERAERSYRDAVKGTEKALEDVTKAREEAKDAIKQLRFELEGGVISEKKARLEFEKARDSLQRVQDLPPNSRARREAEIAFAEADLNLRRAIDKNGKLRKETDKANREGIDGNERVIAAQDKLVKAQENESDAQIDAARSAIRYREAVEDLTKAKDKLVKGGELERENARALELAYRELERALAAQKKAADPGGFDEYQAALDKLSPAAQDFVKYILSLRDALEELRKKLQEAFFPKFTEAVKLLYNTYLDPNSPSSLEGALVRIAGKLGELSLLFAEVFTTPEKQKEINDLFDSFVPIIDALGKAFIALSSAFITLQAAFIPYSIEFAQFLQKKAEAYKESVELRKATGELNNTFEIATGIVRDLGEAFGNTFSAFGNISRAAVGPGSGGQFFLDWFKRVTKGWEDTTKALSESGELQTFLYDLTESFTVLLEVIGLIALGFIKIAATPGFNDLMNSLKEAVLIFTDIGLELGKEGGALTALGDFIVEFSKLIKVFTDSGAITIFFETLTTLLKVINTILSTELGQTLIIVTGSILAFNAALGLSKTVLLFYGDALKGAALGMINFADKGLARMTGLPIVGGAVAKLRQEFMFLTYGLGFVSTPFLIIAAAVAAVVAVLILAYNESEIFRESIKKLIDGVLKALSKAFETIGDALKEVFPKIEGFKDIFKKVGDFLGTYIIPVLEIFLVHAIETVALIISGAIKIVGGFFKAFTDPVAGVKLIISGFKDFLQIIINSIKNIFKIGNIWGFLSDGFKESINKVIGWWNNLRFDLRVPDNKLSRFFGIANDGFTITTPRIPLLAEGGIVYPKSRGTLAMIAEAGRPERVEPLDPDGLSKRDKAMIDRLSGGGINISVYPSAGMDERELAAMVSRQLAFQLRRGAA
jgi:uncharacterized protein YukE